MNDTASTSSPFFIPSGHHAEQPAQAGGNGVNNNKADRSWKDYPDKTWGYRVRKDQG